MSLLVIKFPFRGKLYTWFVDDNYALGISFLLSFVIAFLLKKIRNRRLALKEASNKPPRGGTDLIKCFDVDKIYEVTDSKLKVLIREILQKPGGSLIITPAVVIYAWFLKHNTAAQLALFGTKVVVENQISTVIKVGLGTAAGICLGIGIANPPGLVISITLASTLLLNVYFRNDVNCNDILRELPAPQPIEKVVPAQPRVFLADAPHNNEGQIFLKDYESSATIYQVHETTDQMCAIDSGKQATSEKSTSEVIEVECVTKKNYVPKDRTMTLDDLKKFDGSEQMEKAAPSLQRYQNRRKQIHAERLKNKQV